jgi:ribosomal protein S18 acetylase RimI-like enzyme
MSVLPVSRRFQATVDSLEKLRELLPRLCDHLSLARAHIVLDQVQDLLVSGAERRLLFVTASPVDDVDRPLAAVVAIHSSIDQAVPHRVDTATVLCAGGLGSNWQGGIETAGSALAEKFDQALRDRGVNFVQWATDDMSLPDNQLISKWCGALGFEPLSTLEYLSGSLAIEDIRPNSIDDQSLVCEPLAWDDSAEFGEFASLVEQTYRETLDCPLLSEHRTAIQTLRSYQSTVAFEPMWWFRVLDKATRRMIGCLVLARHRSRDPRSTRDAAENVAEIVYMGLIPEARHRGLGSELLHRAMQVARRGDCSRIILAVDRLNHPAKSLYHRAGFDPLLSETVWFKHFTHQAMVDRVAGQRSA